MVETLQLPVEVDPKDLGVYVEMLHKIVSIGPDTFDPPVRHNFGPGLYIREMFIAKGTLVVGKTHRCATVNIIASGDVSVLTSKGMARFKAPFTVLSDPGIKKIGYAHEDSVWMNVHPNPDNITDLDELERMFVIPYKELAWPGQQ